MGAQEELERGINGRPRATDLLDAEWLKPRGGGGGGGANELRSGENGKTRTKKTRRPLADHVCWRPGLEAGRTALSSQK